MTGAPAIAGSRRANSLLIEGYASLFGHADRSGDIVRAGAFAQTLAHSPKPMLLQHRAGAIAGRWVRMTEDGTGLFVRGLIESDAARTLATAGMNGLSIGFRPQVWTERPDGGRHLSKIELVEVSLVAAPMLEQARFRVIAGLTQEERQCRKK